MAKDKTREWRSRLIEIGTALPEVETSGDQHVGFKVRGKSFAYYLVNHHGDGLVGLAYKAAPGVQQELIDAEPNRFYIPAYVGPKGWVALNLETGRIDWAEVTEMLKQAYRLAAPKKLAQQVD